MAIAGVELRYLVNKISESTQGYYVNNIYGITRDSILFKLHHPEKQDIFLMMSTTGIWITETKIEQIEENKLVKRLRGDLLRLRIKKIEQLASERIAYITFAGFDKEFVIVGEFFGDGNILLCNSEMKILALLHSIDVRHRKLAVGLTYTPPPQNGLNIFELSDDSFEDLRTTDLTAAKWLGRNLGLPKKYVEGVFRLSGIDPKKVGSELTHDDVKIIKDTTLDVITRVINGLHDPVISQDNEALPIKLGDEDYQSVNSFIEGLDTVFTHSLVKKGETIQASGSEKKLVELQTQLAEQERAIGLVKSRSADIASVANSLYEMIGQGISSIEDPSAVEILARNNAKLIRDKGIYFVQIKDEKVEIDVKSSLQSIASVLFNESKRQSAAITSIESIRNKTLKSIEKLQSKAEIEKDSVTYSEVRKKNWFERYRWFYTSDGILAIGGRDSSSNSAIIRKHLGKNDKVFHAEIFGSPFFIMKNVHDLPAASLNEIAHATVCFSRAWREGMYGLNAYWVNPEQVKKSAPSGQFLPKGSFTIEGQRNYIKISTLKMAVGILPYEDSYLLTCGPIEPIKKRCVCYVVIEPSGLEMVDVAKKIRVEFLKFNEEIIKQFTVDDFVRVLPAGKSRIVEVNLENNIENG